MPNESDVSLLDFLAGVEPQKPISHLNLSLMPLTGNGQRPVGYVLGAEAIENGSLTITEVSEQGRVSELLADNRAEQPVLLLDGEVLTGAKQHRVLNATLLLPAKATVKIPVSCVEYGRWRRTSRAFQSSHHSSTRLRALKARDVGRNLRTRGTPTSDQRAVWNEVESCLEFTGTTSPTGALTDSHAQRREAIEQYVQALDYPEGARGVLVAVDGRFAVLDLFDKPATLQSVWPRLLSGYALDALCGEAQRPRPLAVRRLRAALQYIAGVQCQPCPTAGIGEDWRFESEALVGQALVAEGTCIHLCAFPKGDARIPEPPRPASDPPSRRARQRRPDAPDMFAR